MIFITLLFLWWLKYKYKCFRLEATVAVGLDLQVWCTSQGPHSSFFAFTWFLSVEWRICYTFLIWTVAVTGQITWLFHILKHSPFSVLIQYSPWMICQSMQWIDEKKQMEKKFHLFILLPFFSYIFPKSKHGIYPPKWGKKIY